MRSHLLSGRGRIHTATLLALLAHVNAFAGGLDGHGELVPVAGDELAQPLTTWLPDTERPRDGVAVQLVGEGVYRPLVAYLDVWDPVGDGTRYLQSVLVGDLTVANLGARLQHKRLSVDASLPLFTTTSGSLAGGGAALGDLALAGAYALRGAGDGAKWSLGLRPSLRLPTGATHRALGDAGPGGGIDLAGSAWAGPVRVGASIGVVGRTLDSDLGLVGGLGPAFALSAGAAVRPNLAIGAELRGAGGLHSGYDGAPVIPVEAFLTGRARVSDRFTADLGVGRGVNTSAGASAFRAFAGVQLRPPAPAPAVVVQVAQVERAVPEGQFELVVVNPDGEPVPAAALTLGEHDLGQTGEDGRLVVEERSLRAWSKQGLVVQAAGFAPTAPIYPQDDELDGTFTAALAWAPQLVRVVVTSEAGEPIAAQLSSGAGGEPTEVTGAGDLWLPPGASSLSVVAPGYGGQLRDLIVPRTVTQPETVELILHATAGEASIVLDVLDPEGAPVQRAELLIDGNPYGASASGGLLRVDGLAPGPHTIDLRHASFSPVHQELQLVAGENVLRPALARVPGSVVVRVRDAAGPVSDATVVFQGPTRLEPAAIGAKGERYFTLRPGQWSAMVLSPTHSLQARDLVIDEHATGLSVVDVVLGSEGGPAELKLSVVGPTGAPASDVSVWLDGAALGSTASGGGLTVSGLNVGARELTLRGDGRRPVEAQRVFLVEGQQEQLVTVDWLPGMVELRAHDEGGQAVNDGTVRFVGPAERDALALPPSGRTRLQLEPGGWQLLLTSPTRGMVSRSLNLPVDGRRLTLVDLVAGADSGVADLVVDVQDPRGVPIEGASVRLDGALLGHTAEGRLELDDLGIGERLVQAEAYGFLPAERAADLAEGQNQVVLPLAWGPGATLVQVRHDQGAPVLDAVVRLAGPAAVLPSRVDADGDRLLHLDSGVWQVLVSSPEYGLAMQTVEVPANLTELMIVPVNIDPVADGQSTLVLRVIDPAGQPVDGAAVSVDGEQRALTAAGYALVDELTAGAHPLAVSARGHQSLRRDAFTVQPGVQERLLVLDWVPVHVAVTVVDTTGAPVEGAEITVSGPFDVEGALTDARGQALLALPPGGWRVAAQREGMGARTEALNVNLGDDERAVSFTLQAAKVTVTTASVEIAEAVRFDIGSTAILDEGTSILGEVADTLLANPQVARVEVQGHTDSTGSLALNLELSQLRAQAVVAALVARGVAPERLVARGYGATRPVASNETTEGRRTNRRVQFLILEQAGAAARQR